MFRVSILTATLAATLFCPLPSIHAEPVSPRNANGSITKAVPQADGKVIIAGPFSYIGTAERAGIARLQADGSLDPTFDAGIGANGAINLLALQSDGKVLIAGSFTSVAGTARPRIARLNADGTLDSTFDPGAGPDDEISELLIGPGDEAVLAGRFEVCNGITRHFLVRLNANGQVDPTFDAGKNLTGLGGSTKGVLRLAFYPGGQLIAAGRFQAGDKYDLVRLAVDGTVDQSFLAKGLSIGAIAVQPDGKVLVSGFVNGSFTAGLSRLNADGQTDATFRVNPQDVRVQPDGRILVLDGLGVRRLDGNGNDDSTFVSPRFGSGRSSPAFISGIELQSDGRIVISGSFASVNGIPRIGVARLLGNGSVESNFVPAPSIIATGSVLNFSTRVTVGTGDQVLIGGFIVDGTTPKKIMIRAIGPSLARLIANPLLDPRVTLRNSSGDAIARNDNWRATQTGGLITGDQMKEIEASGIPPQNDAESAFIVTLQPGAYTAIVDGAGGGTGVALVEMYDLDGNTAARIANISTRGVVATDDNVLIGGAILGGTHPTEVLVRAIGPSLTASGVSGALADPTLKLYDNNGFLVRSNDRWRAVQEEDIKSTGAAPTDDKEAAILTVLQPGNYTAVVRGENGATGIGLVEFYAL